MTEKRILKIMSFLNLLNKSEESRLADYSLSIRQRNDDIRWLERNQSNFMSILLIEIEKYKI